MTDRPLVFPDTNALLSMLLFPEDSLGKPTLAGEVKDLYEQARFDLTLNHAVVAELKNVVERKFPEHRQTVDLFLDPFETNIRRWPSKEEVDRVRHLVTDLPDAIILASARLTEPDVFLTNDFNSFHTPETTSFLNEENIQVVTLYGPLCLFGKREREE